MDTSRSRALSKRIDLDLSSLQRGISFFSLISSGMTTTFALAGIEARGKLFIGANEKVYPGMVIGECSREQDLEVNPVKAKALTNIREKGKEDTLKLIPPIDNSLEKLICYIQDDEVGATWLICKVIEVTPKSIRSRKKVLDPSKRKQLKKKNGLDDIRFG
jgi:GTP-binding protein